MIYMIYDIFNRNWVDTRWQQYSTHLHKTIHINRERNITIKNKTYITIKNKTYITIKNILFYFTIILYLYLFMSHLYILLYLLIFNVKRSCHLRYYKLYI
jgi:hypothetical protein